MAFQSGEAEASCSSSTRREVHRSRRASPPVVKDDVALVALPLVTRGEALGVVEVVTRPEALRRRQHIVRAVSSQAAILLRNLSLRSELDREVAALEGLVHLAGGLLRATSSRAAVRMAVEACADELGRPVAGWAEGDDPERLELVGHAGLAEGSSRRLRAEMAALPRWSSMTQQDRSEVIAGFSAVVGTETSFPMDVGDAFLVAGGEAHPLLEAVSALVREVLVQLRTVTLAQRRNDQLDLALAWTAHEFRSPLLAVQAALGRLLESVDGGAIDTGLLRSSHEEVQELAGLVEPLLMWAAGAVPLDRRTTDLVGIVREAMAFSPGDAESRVSVSGPEHVAISVDGPHVRTAISNVLRNALSYSPPGSQVHVTIARQRDEAVVTIEDRGPGLEPTERESIFDPFIRGERGAVTRSGRGLGLFIAKRVIEAHGGRIWADSTEQGGTSFNIVLPNEGGDVGGASVLPDDRA